MNLFDMESQNTRSLEKLASTLQAQDWPRKLTAVRKVPYGSLLKLTRAIQVFATGSYPRSRVASAA